MISKASHVAVVQDPLAEYGSDLRLEMCRRVSLPVRKLQKSSGLEVRAFVNIKVIRVDCKVKIQTTPIENQT